MSNRFTRNNSRIIALAREAAERLRHDGVDNGHLLLALLGLEECVAVQLLGGLGVDCAALRAVVAAKMRPGTAIGRARLPFYSGAKIVLGRCVEEADQLGHHFIGSEHLLLALVRTVDAIAGPALDAAGVMHDVVRRALRERSAGPFSPGGWQRHLLLLGSSTLHDGGYLAHWDAIRDYLGEPMRVALVPYGVTDHDAHAAKARAAFATIGHELFSVHRDQDPCAVLRDASAVFVIGGRASWLLEAFHRQGLLQAIRASVWSGMRYIGSGAGANVAALRTTDDGSSGSRCALPTLALVPFQIHPRYRDPEPGSTPMGGGAEQSAGENDTPVLGLRAGGVLRVDGFCMDLRGTQGARLFRRGAEAEELTPPSDLSFLLKTPYPR